MRVPSDPAWAVKTLFVSRTLSTSRRRRNVVLGSHPSPFVVNELLSMVNAPEPYARMAQAEASPLGWTSNVQVETV